MTDKQREYRKTGQKRVFLNLTVNDYNRWYSYASVISLPVSTMIRKAVEKEIAEMEDSFDSEITDLRAFQDDLKKG